MNYGNYRIYCRFTNDAVLPYYKGSTFRGAFGHALKRVTCTLKQQDCKYCLLKQRCLYTLVFETPAAVKPVDGNRLLEPPHPYVIEPPLTIESRFSNGSAFDFSLLLFGDMNKNIPYFVYACCEMGKIGIGKKVNGKKATFILEKIMYGNHTLYTDAEQKLCIPTQLENLQIPWMSYFNKSEFQLKITLETPLRIKFSNRLKAYLPFHILARAMLRRISCLLFYFGNGEPSLDYKGLVKRAEGIDIIYSHLEWSDWRRYSRRQDKDMLMGGMSGSVTYKGNIGEFLPLIDFCSKVHLGKQTAFGLGKINAEVIA